MEIDPETPSFVCQHMEAVDFYAPLPTDLVCRMPLSNSPNDCPVIL